MKKPALSPIISIIILVVITTALVMIVLSFGKDTTNKSLSKTNNFGNISASDAEHYIYPRELKEGTLMFNFNPPASIKDQNIIITHYKINSVIGMEPIKLENPILLSDNKVNIVNLDCLYEYSVKDKLELKLITDQNKYIEIKMHDPTMVCVSGGEGTEDDPKVICTASDLNSIREEDNLSKNYILGKDIDLGCYSRKIDPDKGWEPIGFYNIPFEVYEAFTGFFDGQNHTISNLYINRPEENGIGLFAYIETDSEIKNINLKDANVIGKNSVGGLAGVSSGTLFLNSFFGRINGNSFVGGLVGRNEGLIKNSFSNIIIENNSSDGYNIGGISGTNNGYIRESYSIGNIFSAGDSVGGLVGINRKYISDSYSFCDLEGKNYVGGLVGDNQIGIPVLAPPVKPGEIYSSYSVGKVVGINVGGLLGKGEPPKTDSFYDKNTSGRSDTVRGTPKITEDMKNINTFINADWDFSTIWGISPNINNGYPYLKSNPPK